MTGRSLPLWVGATPDAKVPPRVRLTLDDIFDRAATDPNTGCWFWDRGVQSAGYGCWPTGNRKWQLAHRVAYQITHGELTPKEVVCHRCDQPLCVNPDHLFAGSQADNLADMVAKGRSRTSRFVGSHHPAARLIDDDVRAIRNDPRAHWVVAMLYGVSKTTVSQIRRRETWGHVR